ncbi:MAG: hypothetical protein ACMG6E_09130 [Candidatus Roizmanbacteria bacterium]
MSNMLEVYKKTKKELGIKLTAVEERLTSFPMQSKLTVYILA